MIVVSGSSERSIILDHNPELSYFGIKKGLPLARTSGEGLTCLLYDDLKERTIAISDRITEYLLSFSPIVESGAMDSYYIDLSGTERLFGPGEKVCREIIEHLANHFGLTAKTGIGPNLFSARIGALLASSGEIKSIPGTEALFKEDIPLSLLPGLTEEERKILEKDINITSLRELKEFSGFDLRALCPEGGEELFRNLHGKGRDFLIAKLKQRELKGSILIHGNGNDDTVIRKDFFALLGEMCLKMRNEKVIPGTLLLQFSYRDSYRKYYKIRIKNQSNIEFILKEELGKYLAEGIGRRVMMKEISMVFSGFDGSFNQPDFFSEESHWEKLIPEVDRVRKKYGEKALKYGT